MTDYELMLFRFNRKNIRKSTGAIANKLGMDRKAFEEAVKRGLEEENKRFEEVVRRGLKEENKKGEKNEV